MAAFAALAPAGVSLATSLYLQSQQKSPDINAMMDAADPFRNNRAQYQTQLQQLMTGGFSPSDPSYGFRQQEGTDAVLRGAAATGQSGSGLQMAQLQQVGQQTASQEYGNQYKRLAELAGVNAGSPAGAAGIMSDQATNAQNRTDQGIAAISGFVGSVAKAGMTPSAQPQSSGPPVYDASGNMIGGGGVSLDQYMGTRSYLPGSVYDPNSYGKA